MSSPRSMNTTGGELAAELANILSAVVVQIRGLTDDEVRSLAAGDAEFRLVPKKAAPARKTRAAPAVSTVDKGAVDKGAVDKGAVDNDLDSAGIQERLKACTSEADAQSYLQSLKLTLPSAKALATALGLRLPARPTVTSINAEIIRVFVGGRLNALTVQRL